MLVSPCYLPVYKDTWWSPPAVYLTIKVDVGLPLIVGMDSGLQQSLTAGQPKPVVEEC